MRTIEMRSEAHYVQVEMYRCRIFVIQITLRSLLPARPTWQRWRHASAEPALSRTARWHGLQLYPGRCQPTEANTFRTGFQSPRSHHHLHYLQSRRPPAAGYRYDRQAYPSAACPVLKETSELPLRSHLPARQNDTATRDTLPPQTARCNPLKSAAYRSFFASVPATHPVPAASSAPVYLHESG